MNTDEYTIRLNKIPLNVPLKPFNSTQAGFYPAKAPATL
jgi:hypothetical protein